MTELSPEQIKAREDFYREQDEARREREEQRRRPPDAPGNRVGGSLLRPRRPSEVVPGRQVTAVIPGQLAPSRVPPVQPEEEPRDVPLAVTARPEAAIVPKPRPWQVRRLELQLQQQFPGIVIDYFTLTQPDLTFLEQRMTAIPGFVRSLLGTFLTQDAERRGIRLRLLSAGTDESGASKGVQVIAAAPKLPGKDSAFAINQTYSPQGGGVSAYIETVAAQGRGKEYFRTSVLPQAKQFNIEKVSLQASNLGTSASKEVASGDPAAFAGAGVVAWARYGFVPTREDWNVMRGVGRSILDEKPWKQKDRSAARKLVKTAIGDPSPRALRRLVFLSWQERKMLGEKGPTTDLLNRILGRSWNGEIDLANPDDREWLETYVSTRNPEDHLQTFERLLDAPTYIMPSGFLSRLTRRELPHMHRQHHERFDHTHGTHALRAAPPGHIRTGSDAPAAPERR